jgi:hypothetical protein
MPITPKPNTPPAEPLPSLPCVLEHPNFSLVNANGIRTRLMAHVGTNTHLPDFIDQNTRKMFKECTFQDWETTRIMGDEDGDKDNLRIQLGVYYDAVARHQLEFLRDGNYPIFANLRLKAFWRKVFAVLLAPFQIQLYVENTNRSPKASWFDVSTSRVPHDDEKDEAINAALLVS